MSFRFQVLGFKFDVLRSPIVKRLPSSPATGPEQPATLNLKLIT
jgi:hypothetical protein